MHTRSSFPRTLRTAATVLIAAMWPTIVAAQSFQFGPPLPLNTNAATDTAIDYFAHITTDGAGHWVAVWEHAEPFGGSGHSYLESDIYTARSSDNGITWTAPGQLYPDPPIGESFDGAPAIATDGTTWIAVWRIFTVTNGHLSDNDLLTSRSTDAGATWAIPGPLNSDAATDGNRDDGVPQIATDRAGTWVAVWQAQVSGGGYQIYTARSTDAGLTWSAPGQLATAFGIAPRIATDGSSWVVVWQGQVGGDDDVMTSRSADGGVSWSAPAALNANAAVDVDYDQYPQIATDGGGTWLAVWTLLPAPPADPDVPTDQDVLVARSTDGGATWSAPAPLNIDAAVDTGDDAGPSVTADGHGMWIAAWVSYDTLGGTLPSGYGNIFQARSTDGGVTWSAPTPLNSDAPFDECHYRAYGNPEIAIDGAGVWLAMFEGAMRGCPVDYGLDGDLFRARASTACGNGVVDPGEDCDDGGLVAGDGCDPSCHVEPPPSVCGNGIHERGEECDDGNHTSDDGCDPSCHFDPPPSVCGNGVVEFGETCDDGNVVPGDGCDENCHREPPPSFTCGDGVVQPGEDCDDGNQVAGDGCDPGCHFEPCHATPDPSCGGVFAGKMSLKMRRDAADAGKNRLEWKWRGLDAIAKADFGNPVIAEYYSLCVYDADTLVSTTRVDAAVQCGGRPCWRALKNGYVFKDKTHAEAGTAELALRAGAAGKPTLHFVGGGANLAAPPLPATGPVVVQLRRGNEPFCWAATFAAPFRKNDGSSLVGR